MNNQDDINIDELTAKMMSKEVLRGSVGVLNLESYKPTPTPKTYEE